MAKGSVRKKERNGTTASMQRTQAAIWFKKNTLEQKVKVKRKNCSIRQWMITKARNSLQSRKILQLENYLIYGQRKN